MNVGIVGLGYVGLPLAMSFCEAGHTVMGVDVDPRKIADLANGESYVEDVSSERLRAMSERLFPTGPLRRALALRRRDHRRAHAAHAQPRARSRSAAGRHLRR